MLSSRAYQFTSATMVSQCFVSQAFRRSSSHHRTPSCSILWRLLSQGKIGTPAEAGKRAEELAHKTTTSSSTNPDLDTILAHAGVTEHRPTNIPLAPPLEFASTYTRPSAGPYNKGDAVYSRADNPTRLLLEETVLEMECFGIGDVSAHSDMTCAFASGMMAASSIVMAHKTPLTVLLPTDVYHGVFTVLADVFERFGNVEIKRTNMVDLEELERALNETTATSTGGSVLVWLETPSNPRCDVIDLEAVTKMVDRCRESTNVPITTVVDSTLAPPVVQQPLEFGVDVVMHSGTKYLGGHSDVLLGITTASPFTEHGRKMGPLLRQVQTCVGGVASPMDAWLTLRGLRTLSVRVEKQCGTAMQLAQYLYNQQQQGEGSLVTAVHYPGLESHPKHDTAKRQMKDGNFGGVLSVEFQSEHLAMAFAGALKTIHRATSLGGTETLIEHRASIEPPHRVVSPPGLLRISVGLEHANDLVQDVEQALRIVQQVQEELS